MPRVKSRLRTFDLAMTPATVGHGRRGRIKAGNNARLDIG